MNEALLISSTRQFEAAARAEVDAQDRQRSADAGFDPHLVKPVLTADLERSFASIAERGSRHPGRASGPTLRGAIAVVIRRP